jgi:hypothetical protein
LGLQAVHEVGGHFDLSEVLLHGEDEVDILGPLCSIHLETACLQGGHVLVVKKANQALFPRFSDSPGAGILYSSHKFSCSDVSIPSNVAP